MHIDRQNYENFFLLYVDRELNVTDQKAVETFAALHPDLQEELNGLLAVQLPQHEPSLQLPNKNCLYRPCIWENEQLSDVQSKLLLMVDEALADEEAVLLSKAISNDAWLKNEWQWLKKTKLPEHDGMEMPNKAALYRKSSTKVVPFGWVRWSAVAALVIGMGWFLWWPSGSMQESEKPKIENELTIHSQTVSLPTSPLTTKTDSLKAAMVLRIGQQNRHEIAIQPSKTLTGQPDETQTDTLFTKRQTLNLLTSASTNNKVLQAVGGEKNVPVKDAQMLIAAAKGIEAVSPQTASTTTSNTAFQQAVYNEEGVSNSTEERINIAGASIRKQKIRGIFRTITRKIGRSFEKSSVAQVDEATQE